MSVNCFCTEYYEDLVGSIRTNIDRYASDDAWVPMEPQTGMVLRSSFAGDLPELTHEEGEDINLSDAKNAKALFSGMSKLTPAQASDRRLWAYLAHTSYYKYVRSRWLVEGKPDTIKKRFFVSGSSMSGLYYNAISRLWWTGYVCYRASSDNWEKLVDILFQNQQSWKDLLDYRYSHNTTILIGMINSLSRYSEEYGSVGIVEPWRKTCKFLSRYGATKDLDSMEASQIEELAYNYLVSLRG